MCDSAGTPQSDRSPALATSHSAASVMTKSSRRAERCLFRRLHFVVQVEAPSRKEPRMDTMELYRRAQDGFDAVLTGVGPQRWDGASACPEWTVRDVAGR